MRRCGEARAPAPRTGVEWHARSVPQPGVRVVCVQLECPSSEGAHDRLRRVLAQLRSIDDADLVVLPELWMTGYFSFDRYAQDAEPLDGPVLTALRRVARERRWHMVAGSMVERSPNGRLHNTTVLIGPDGDLLQVYRKVHLFGHGSREAELLTPGRDVITSRTPFGTVGLATCYDLRFPELFRLLVDQAAEIIVVVSAWPHERLDHWRILTRARAVENQVLLVACNAAGWQAGRRLAGNSVIVDPWGVVLAEGGDAPSLPAATFDTARVADVRAAFPALAHRRFDILLINRLGESPSGDNP